VKIDLHGELLAQRRELAARRLVPAGKRLGLRFVALVLAHRALYEAAGRLLRLALRRLPRRVLLAAAGGWGRRRELPAPPEESFRDAWRRMRGGGDG
jgi:L-lactate dehydrogenase complex protein LldF